MSQLKHIAFASPRFAEGATVGGAETLLRRLAERLAAAGHKVTFLATCAQNHFTWENILPPGEKQHGDLRVIYFPVDEDRDVGAFLRTQTAISNRGRFNEADEEIWIRNSVNSQAMYEHLREHGNDYDRIITGPYLFGISYYVSQIHPEKTLMVPCLHDEPFAYVDIMRNAFEAVSGFMFNSVPEMDLARTIFDTPEEKCHVVGMGLDPFDVDKTAFAKHHGIEVPYILYSGRREPLKGTPLLLDYLNAFRLRTGNDIKLVLTGSGPVEPPDELAPHIFDVGFVSEKEKHEAMAGALAFCHPSTLESFGIVIMESWLAGTPVLVHAGSEVLRYQCQQSGGGLWFRSYPEFEEELGLLLEHSDLRDQMGQAGKDYVQKTYTWEPVEQRMMEALQGGHA